MLEDWYKKGAIEKRKEGRKSEDDKDSYEKNGKKGKKEKQNKINESRYNNIDKNEGIAKIFGRKEERKKLKFNSQI